MHRPVITALFVAAFMVGPVACTHDKPTPAPSSTRPPSSSPTSAVPSPTPTPSEPVTTSPVPSESEPGSPPASGS